MTKKKKKSFLSVLSTLIPSALKQELPLCTYLILLGFLPTLINPGTAIAFQPVLLQNRDYIEAKATLLL